MANTEQEQPAQGVRFSEVNEEIEPDQALKHVASLSGAGDQSKEELSPEAQEELRNLSMSLQQSRCQAKRMENFSFEPVSLPASRVSSKLPLSRFTADPPPGTFTISGIADALGTIELSLQRWPPSISTRIRDAFPALDPRRHLFAGWKT